MQKRIFKNMAVLAGSILLVVLLIAGLIFYEFFYTTRENEVKNEAEYIASALNDMQSDEILAYMEDVSQVSSMRVTLIREDGTVLYDNELNPAVMGNHKDRPEVKAAQKDGYSHETRLSETLEMQTFYYAVRLRDASVIRVSCSTRSIYMMLVQFIPAVLFVLGIVLVIALSMAGKMTRAIVNPINNINLSAPSMDFDYEEFTPLLHRIRDYNAEVDKNEQLRREFSANVSHELKTPLTSISGYAELMMNGMVKPEDVPEFANKIYTESGRMQALVEDIIKLSRLDEKKVAIEKEPCNLLDIAHDMEDSLSAVGRKYKVMFEVSGIPVRMQAVPVMMEEVMYNLCSNAIKYNHPGGYAKLTIGYDHGQPMIQVSDNGIGISEEHQNRIFERFYRVDKSHSKQTGGTGLGLAIVKHVVEYHNGTIQVVSQEGKGTVITIVFAFDPKQVHPTEPDNTLAQKTEIM